MFDGVIINKDNNQLTVYKNELNSVPFRKFSSAEMDLFITICTQMRDKGLDDVTFAFADLKKISNYASKDMKRFIKDLKGTYDRLLELKFSHKYIAQNNDSRETRFVLFSEFDINYTQENITIKVNPTFKYILNDITSEFTKFELQAFTNLKSSYAKTTFRLLKQFRMTGFWKIHITDFRELLDIPESYTMSKISSFVLKSIQKELSPIFEGLTIKKIASKQQGKAIEYIEFHFKPEDDLSRDDKKTFRAGDGSYYKKNLDEFTQEEIDKTFPPSEAKKKA